MVQRGPRRPLRVVGSVVAGCDCYTRWGCFDGEHFGGPTDVCRGGPGQEEGPDGVAVIRRGGLGLSGVFGFSQRK